jgi:hypothetical protein
MGNCQLPELHSTKYKYLQHNFIVASACIGSLYQRHVTDIRERIYNSIARGIIVQIQIVFVYIGTLSYYTIYISLVLNSLIRIKIMNYFQMFLIHILQIRTSYHFE